MTAPVKANESLTIRTSTMVTGVRGTSGWVEIVDRYTTRFSLLEGELEITSIDPLTGNERSITIVGGQTATVVYHDEMNDYVTELFVERLTVQKLAEAGVILDMDVLGEMIAAGVIPEDATLQELINSGVILDEEALHDLLAEGGMDEETIQQLLESGMLPEDVTIQKLIQEGTIREEHIILDGTGLTVEELQEEDVPGYVAVEVEKNEELQQRIEETTKLDVEEIIGDAEEKLAEEEAADEAADQTIQEAFETLTAEDTDPLFEEEEEASTGSTSDVPAASTYSLDDPTNQDVLDAMADGLTTLTITNANTNNTWNIWETNPTIDSTITMDVQSGTVNVPAGETLNVDGTLNVGGTMNNNGTVNITSTNSLHVSGSLTNNGTINVGVGTDPGTLAVESGGELTNNGTINVIESSTFSNDGEVNNDRAITITGGSVANTQTFNNNGTLTLDPAGNTCFANSGDFNNNGSMTGAGDFDNQSAGTLTVYTNSTLTVPVSNSGNFVVPQGQSADMYTNVTFNTDSTLTNKGTINVAANETVSFAEEMNVINEGAITVAEGGTLNVLSNLTGAGGITINADGTLNVGSATTESTLTIPSGVTLTNNGTLSVAKEGTLINEGTIANTGTVTNSGVFDLAEGSVLKSEGAFTSSGTVSNSGSIERTAEFGGVMHITGGRYTNESTGTVTSPGSGLSVDGGSVVFQGGSVIVTGASSQTTTGQISYGGYAIFAAFDGADITLNGNTKIECTKGTAIYSAKTLTVNDETCSIIGGRNGVNNHGTLTMYAGSISGGNGAGVNGYGIDNSGTILLEGGTVSSGNGSGINDSTSGKEGTITIQGNAKVNGYYGISINYTPVLVGGNAVIEGRFNGIYMSTDYDLTIQDSASVKGSSTGSGVYYSGNGTVTIDGGAITGCNYGIRQKNGTLNVNGGTMAGASSGIYSDGSETVDMTVTGGTIQGGDFGGICKYSNGTLEVSGTANVSGTLYGIRLQDGVNTVTIKDNVQIRATDTTDVSPYALYNDCSNVTIAGGTIISDHPTNGYGISNAEGGTMTITSGTVEATTAVDNVGTLTIGGDASIIGAKIGISNDSITDTNGTTEGTTIINGGLVSGTKCGVDSSNNNLTVSGGTVECTGTTGYVVDANTFVFSSGTLQKPSNNSYGFYSGKATDESSNELNLVPSEVETPDGIKYTFLKR